MSRPTLDDAASLARRTLYDVAYAALVGASHLERARNLAVLAADRLLPPQSGWLVWDKERPDDLDQATCELAWTDCVKGVRRFRHLWNGAMRASENDTSPVHPTQKPVELMQWCLGLRWKRERGQA